MVESESNWCSIVDIYQIMNCTVIACQVSGISLLWCLEVQNGNELLQS